MGAALEQPLRAHRDARGGRCVACGAPIGAGARYGAATLARCGRCGSLTGLPRPSSAETAGLHDSEAYFAKPYFASRRGRESFAERRFHRLLALLARVRPELRLNGGRLLDVGCDTGDFAAAAARVAGVVPYGIDVARRPLERARDAGLETFRGDLGDAPAGFDGFAIVTAVDVIEHAPDPGGLLGAARARLDTGGLVYLETPNPRSVVYAIGRLAARIPRIRRAAALERLFPPEHAQYLTRQGVVQLAATAGLRPIAVFERPLERDAIAGTAALRLALAAVQLVDRARRRGILVCALLEAN